MTKQLLSLLFSILVSSPLAGSVSVIINEIHYDPDVKTELVEFVELYNPGSADIDLTGWYFSNGIVYQFPAGSILPADGYIIVAQNPDQIQNKWDFNRLGITADSIYGPFEGKLANDGEKIELCNANGEEIDQVDYQLGFPWPIVGDAVPDNQPGTGRSIQLINPMMDNDLGGSWRSASPTPAANNAMVYLNNPPPLIRQVEHSPKQPKSGQTVTITAKVTDSDGVSNVTLRYQIVEPGSYIPVTIPNYPSTNPATKPNPAYETGWASSPMHDDGLNGDAVAGDGIYTIQLPASLQRHRRLIRYRIVAQDSQSNSLQVPYEDDPQPNFAYFVYDGVPTWRGAINPNGSWPDNQLVTYSAELMRSLPVYHLLSREIDIQNCQYNAAYDNTAYYFSGTLVYDGQIYDNVYFRIRGQYSAFQTGKEKWKFDFNRGHYFQARDDYGKKYKSKWDKMNVGTGTCPWWQYPHPGNWDRGTRGMVMNEALAFRLYNMAGVPSCNTNYFQLRVIDNALEADSADQYEGDFWGLYLAIEHPDGAFLDEHGLPDGNVYRMDGGPNKTHQGQTQVANNSDVTSFVSMYNSHPNKNWWAQNVNLTNYYSSRAIGEAINDSDRRPESNCVFYHDPQTEQWWMLPWDLDLTFEWATHYTDWEHFRYALDYPEYSIAGKNRSRELLDLLFNNDQAPQLIDEIASIISTAYDDKTFVEANQAMWDYHPRTVKKGQFYENNEFLETKDWPGLIEYYKKFLTPTGFSNMVSGSYGVYALTDEAADSSIPRTPTITYTGPAGFPADDLTFEAGPFSDPQGSGTFSAMKWRLAEVEPNAEFLPPAAPQADTVTIIEAESPEWKYFKGNAGEPSTPVDAWRQIDFDDSHWLTGKTSIGYGDNDDNTMINDMQNNYSSIYLRHRFNVSDIDQIDMLKLNLYVDDGCIIWINGTEVARVRVSSGFKSYDDLSDEQYVDNAIWETISLPGPYDYLVEGENIIAVHVLNSSLSSSDLSIDMSLIAQTNPNNASELPSETGLTQGARGKYEIDAVWESEEIAPYSRTITLPVGAAQAGRTYRVRCQMKDNTGRWSHWSDPIQFEAGEPLSAEMLDELRITELMYNPANADTAGGELATDNENFEFVELKNIGPETIDLNQVRFTNGIDFTFDEYELGAGEYVLVVQDLNAFETRYGPMFNIAGQYSGRLDNGGEKIRLENAAGQTILEFSYDNNWYDLTDGLGYSLTIIDPANPDPNSWDQQSSWRPSVDLGGSPGWDDFNNH
jgi:hypothetical protein